MRPKTYSIEFTDEAIDDLKEIGEWIARDSHEAAWSLAQMPRRGRLAPEWRIDETETRQLIRHSHRVVYTILGSTVLVITIIHGSREPRRER
ncbi:MAG: type II toxin-antitoxin system RelE/ParE family toxin [Phycisphaerales bacterium]